MKIVEWQFIYICKFGKKKLWKDKFMDKIKLPGKVHNIEETT